MLIKKIKTRVCKDCKKEYPISQFHRVTKNKQLIGYHTRCKKCFLIRYGQKKIIKKHTAISSTARFVNTECPFYKMDNTHLHTCLNPVLMKIEFIRSCREGNPRDGTCAIIDKTVYAKMKAQ